MSATLSRLDRLRDPLLERDYLRLCSRPATFRNRALAALGIGVVFLLMYGTASRFQSTDRIGSYMHTTFAWLASFYVGSLAMNEAAVAIPTERATGTLTVLLTVPRTPRRLAAGFFLSRLLAALTGFLAVLPVDGAALLLGGVSLRSFLLSLLLVTISGVWGAAVGLFSGYGAPTHRHAQGRAFFFSLVLVVLLPLIVATIPPALQVMNDQKAVLTPPTEKLFYEVAAVLFVANPLGAVLFFTGGGPPMPGTGPWVYLIPTGTALLFAVGAVLQTGARLRDDTERSILAGSGAGPLGWLKRLFGRRGAPASASPAAALPVAAEGRHRVWSRPLWWKESRPPRSAWQRFALYIGFTGYFLLFAWIFFSKVVRENLMPDGRQTAFYDVAVSFPFWVVLLGSMAAGGTFLAEERERKSLDHLRTAPLRPSDFILARVVAVAVRIAPLFAVSALFVVIGAFRGQVHPLSLVAWLIGFLPVGAFLSLFCFSLGMKAPTVRAAHRRAGGVVGGCLAVWPIATLFVGAMFHRQFSEIMLTLALDPLASCVGPFLMWYHHQFPGDIGSDSMKFARVGCIALVLWGFLAWRLWHRLPQALDRALHAGEEN